MLQLMIQFMDAHSGRLKDNAHGLSTVPKVHEASWNKAKLRQYQANVLSNPRNSDALDSFVEDLFDLLVAKQLDWETLRAVWRFLQVRNNYLTTSPLC